MTDAARLREEVGSHEWYHTLELAPGVVTPGWFDVRELAPTLPWPDLRGLRCLDVGTFDGFWAFEMERRGAAEVVAIDLLDLAQADWPAMPQEDVISAIGKRKAAGRGFELARDTFGSSVQRVEMNVYDLDQAVVGSFDFVYLGSLLLHLRDPVRALERVRGVCKGELLVVDAVDLGLTALMPKRPAAILDGKGRPWWWKPNLAGLVRLLEAAGFDPIGQPKTVFMKPGVGQPLPPLRPRLLTSRAGRQAALLAVKGEPHAAIRAKPR